MSKKRSEPGELEADVVESVAEGMAGEVIAAVTGKARKSKT
jgi:hypothetical protein